MKKILFIITFGCIQFAGAEKLILLAPFTELPVEVHFAADTKLVNTALVADEEFTATVKKDCESYFDTLRKYGPHLNDTDLQDLARAPLPYSMKHEFEAELSVDSERSLVLSGEGDELQLSFVTGSKPIVSVLSQAERETFSDMNSVNVAIVQNSVHLKFSRRDLLCEFLSGQVQIQLPFHAAYKPGTSQVQKMESIFGVLSKSVQSVLDSGAETKKQAAVIGFRLAQTMKDPALALDKPFSSIEYLWSVLFTNDDSVKKSALWRTDFKSAVFQQSPVVLTLKGNL